MTLSDLASIGSFISGVGVLVSLVYLGFQLRQNTLTHRATAYQSRQEFLKEQLKAGMDLSLTGLRRRIDAGDETVTDDEYQRYIAMQTAWFVGNDHLVWLHDNKILDDAAFQTENIVLGGALGQPGVRATWETWKRLATPAFRKLVEQHLANPAAIRFDEISHLDLWKSELALARKDRAARRAQSN